MTAPAESKKSNPWVGLIKYAVAVALLSLVVWQNWADKAETNPDGTGYTVPGLPSLLQRQPDWAVFALCAGMAATVFVSQYVRWYVLVRALDLPFTVRNAIRLGMVGTFYNTFLPGAIGGDVMKAFFIAKGAPGRRAAAVSTVVADRILGLFGLLVFGGLIGGGVWVAEVAAGQGGRISDNRSLQWIIVGSGLAALGVATGYVALGWVSPARAERIDGRLKGVRKVGPTLAELFETGLRYRRRPKAVLAGVGLSAVGHTLMMLLIHFAVRVYPPLLPDGTVNEGMIGTFAEHVIIAPIGFIVQAVVPLPGGLGVAELSFGGLYELLRPGGGKVVGLTGRLALRVIEWTLGGICYVVYLTMKAELPATPTKEEVEAAATLEAVPAGERPA